MTTVKRPICFSENSFTTATLLLLAVTASLQAQFNLGTITGTVLDPNGGAVAGCAVKVVSLTSLNTRTVSTNSIGLYTAPSLPADTYEVTAEAAGFQRATVRLTIGVDQTVNADFHLKLGNVSEQIQVTSQATRVEVEKDSYEISNVLATQELQNLPANGRSFMSLAAVGPGAGKASDSAGQPGAVITYSQTSHEVALAGQTLGSTTFLQDGVLNMNMVSQTANIVPSIESVQEVSVESSGMSARFPSPGLVNVISKRGTNSFHGTVYDYLENNALNARSFFAVTKPVLRYNQFGANLGAPIVKNKLFGFFDYAGQRQTSAAVSRSRIPTADERQGNFQTEGLTIYDPATFNPATGAISPFPNATIPANRISPFASRFLNYFPAAQGPVVGGINYQVNLSSPSPYDQYLGRVDYNLSSKDTLYAGFQTSNSPTLAPSIVNGLFGVLTQNSGKNTSLQDIHIYTPNLINIARVGYNRSVLFVSQQGIGSQDFLQLFGLQNLTISPDRSVPPTAAISGLTVTLGNPTNPMGGTQNLFQYADEVNWTKGRHQIFVGAELDRFQFNGVWQQFADGSYTFNGQYVSNHGTGSALKLGPGLGDFLLGYPSMAMGGQGLPAAAYRGSNAAGYFEDTWKILRHLTLNLGLRYEFYQPPADKWGKASLFDVPTDTAIVGAWRSNYKNFGPRAGFAYEIAKNTVIRSGFGIYYNSGPFQYLMLDVGNYPVFILQSVIGNINSPVPVTNQFVAHPAASAQTPYAVSPREPTPYTEQWNFGIQHSFGSNLLASVNYVGNGSHQQSLRFNQNEAVPDTNPAQPTPVQSRRPFPLVGDVIAQYNMANGTYESLQSTLHYRFSHGLSLQANFTWSKALTLSDDGATQPVNGLNAKESSYGPANFDRARVFTASYVYELPIGNGKPFLNSLGWASKQVLGGWQMSGITVVETGIPFQITATDTANTGQHIQVADRLCNGNLSSGQRTLQHWFQTSCFAQPSAGRLGNSGRNPLWGPGVTNFDLSAFKRFPFGEKQWVQFRTDFFSAFNHPQFAIGGTQAITAPTYGQVTSAAGSRLIQMSLQVSF